MSFCISTVQYSTVQGTDYNASSDILHIITIFIAYIGENMMVELSAKGSGTTLFCKEDIAIGKSAVNSGHFVCCGTVCRDERLLFDAANRRRCLML